MLWWWLKYGTYMDVLKNAVSAGSEFRVYLRMPREIRPFIAEQLWAIKNKLVDR